jgi:hypothetical protein
VADLSRAGPNAASNLDAASTLSNISDKQGRA